MITIAVDAGRMSAKTSPWARAISGQSSASDDEHPRPDDVLESGAGPFERFAHDLEAEPHLVVGAVRRITLLRDRRGSRDMDVPARLTTARE